LFSVFSAMALALALVGIFSVVAYSVAQRTTEFGVRLTLGASRAHILWVAARIALVSAAAGIVIGLAFDSFLGAVLAIGCKAPLPQAVCSKPPRCSLSAHSSPAYCPPATLSPSRPPKLSAMNKACPV
jgi:ABC-type antimicrobial peptide transport system permease subunit